MYVNVYCAVYCALPNVNGKKVNVEINMNLHCK